MAGDRFSPHDRSICQYLKDIVLATHLDPPGKACVPAHGKRRNSDAGYYHILEGWYQAGNLRVCTERAWRKCSGGSSCTACPEEEGAPKSSPAALALWRGGTALQLLCAASYADAASSSLMAAFTCSTNSGGMSAYP